ncbi:MAG: sensor histidine kinase [Jatrophihabitans sp.]
MRKRIAGLTVLAAMLATFVFGVPLAIAAAHYFVIDEQRELERTADVTALAVSGDLTRAHQAANIPAHEHGLEVSVYNAAGARVVGPGPAPSDGLIQRALHGAVASGDINGRIAAAVAVSDGDSVVGAVLVTADHSQVDARIARAWAGMFALALAAVAAAWLIAHRLSRRIAGPMERLAIAAERLGDGDFSVRTAPSGIAEIDTANASLARTAERLGNLVERERAFSADASHQLRTPLTGLQLGLEAALDTTDADLRVALGDALVIVRQLEGTVSELLALARDRPRDNQILDVDILMNDLRTRWNGLLAASDRPLRIAVERDIPRTPFSRAAVNQILDVLLDNALKHGRGSVTVTVRDAEGALGIDVSDDGPPLVGDSRELFRRRSADAAGTGIGLALARRLAESEGGRLTLSSTHPPRFTLLAPPHGDDLTRSDEQIPPPKRAP